MLLPGRPLLCALSRREVAARTVDGIFRGETVPGATAPWRLDVRAAARLTGPLSFTDNGIVHDIDFARVSDDILVRRDTGTSYHIAVVHDDALQNVTHVIRGEDLTAVTPLHVLLQTLLGLPIPTYQHHRLVLDESGKRFAKRDQAATMGCMRQDGVSVETVLARLRD